MCILSILRTKLSGLRYSEKYQYLCSMNAKTEAKIVYSTLYHLIRSVDFSNWVIHMLCMDGEAWFVYDGRSFSVSRNDVVIITKPQMISDTGQSEDLRVEIIAAPGEFLHNQLPTNNFGIGGAISLFDNPVIHLGDEDAQKLLDDMHAIRKRIDDMEHPFYRELIGSLALTMMYDLFAFHKQERISMYASDRSMYIVKELMAMLEAGTSKYHREVNYYAAQLNVTPKYLSDTVRRQTGHNVTYFIARHTLPIIKKYLNNPHLSIAQISDEMKFGNPASFTRYASRYLGMSPKHYRASLMSK